MMATMDPLFIYNKYFKLYFLSLIYLELNEINQEMVLITNPSG